MASRFLAVTLDCRETGPLVRFWCAALGYTELSRWTDAHGREYVEIGQDGQPMIVFQPVPEEKTTKNRLHLDIAPTDRGQAEEVERLVGLGAVVRADQPEFPWVVLTDPAGNEFCVLPPRES